MPETDRTLSGLPYPVIVAADGVAAAAQVALDRGAPVVIVCDVNVAPRALALATSLRDAAAELVALIPVRAGERAKRLRAVERLYDRLSRAGVDRRALLVAVGGGTLTDMAGFTAATYARGISWLPVATTILGMADAAIGSKTGINTPAAKNAAGAFWDPVAVVADLDSIRTLPARERRTGIAEIVKAAVVGDAGLLEQIGRVDISADASHWRPLIEAAASVKIRVVASDPRDTGARGALNLGHTIAHGLEFASGFRMTHGAAVSVGLRAEGLIAAGRGWWPAAAHAKVLGALMRCRLPVAIDGLSRTSILAGIRRDKKRKGAVLRFALPAAIGDVRVGVEVSEAEIVDALRACEKPPAAGELSST